MSCLNHPDKEAQYFCVSCGVYLCDECVKDLRIGGSPTYVCLKCKGRCRSVEDLKKDADENREIARSRDFWEQLPGIFAFPLKGEGPYIVSGATILFTLMTIVHFIATIAPNAIANAIALVVSPFVIWIIAACFLGVLERIAISDDDEPPQLPDLMMDWGWVGNVLILMVAAGLCLIPALVYADYVDRQDLFYWLLFGAGFYFFPMFMLYISLGERFSFLNPAKSLVSIKKNWVAYSVIPLLWLGLLVAWNVISQVISIERFSIFGFVGKWFLFVYFLYVSTRPLGVFFRAYEDRLVGFDSEVG